MPGRETVPPDPDEVRTKDEGATRPGTGAPGEDAATGPVGARGERETTGTGPPPSDTGAHDTHEEARAAAPFTEPGDRLPARRLHEVTDEEDAE